MELVAAGQANRDAQGPCACPLLTELEIAASLDSDSFADRSL